MYDIRFSVYIISVKIAMYKVNFNLLKTLMIYFYVYIYMYKILSNGPVSISYRKYEDVIDNSHSNPLIRTASLNPALLRFKFKYKWRVFKYVKEHWIGWTSLQNQSTVILIRSSLLELKWILNFYTLFHGFSSISCSNVC